MFIKKFNSFLKESINSSEIRYGDVRSNWGFSQSQIMELLSDFTDDKCDIRLMDNKWKKCINLHYFFNVPNGMTDKNYEKGDLYNYLYHIVENMDEIVEKLLDCGYNIKYDGFKNSSAISHYNSRGRAFCEIYPKSEKEIKNYDFSTKLDQEHRDLIRLG